MRFGEYFLFRISNNKILLIFLGIFYDKELHSYLYGHFNRNKCTKLIKKGKGFPYELLSKKIIIKFLLK
jgi:hypothetical protein